MSWMPKISTFHSSTRPSTIISQRTKIRATHWTAALKERSQVVCLGTMPACRMCKQNYPDSQFISGNGPRYQVCARCGIEHGLVDPEDAPQYYSDDILNARFALYTARHLPWISVLLGWILYLVLGRGIELWSNLLLTVLAMATLIVPVRYFLRSAKFSADLSRLTP